MNRTEIDLVFIQAYWHLDTFHILKKPKTIKKKIRLKKLPIINVNLFDDQQSSFCLQKDFKIFKYSMQLKMTCEYTVEKFEIIRKMVRKQKSRLEIEKIVKSTLKMKPLMTSQKMLIWFGVCPTSENPSGSVTIGQIIVIFLVFSTMLSAIVTSALFFVKFVSIDLEKSLQTSLQIAAAFSILYMFFMLLISRFEVSGVFSQLMKISNACKITFSMGEGRSWQGFEFDGVWLSSMLKICQKHSTLFFN